MIDQAKASRLASDAFDHWQAGRREQASLMYEEAIPLADPNHYGLPSYYGEHACVLNELGRHEQATIQLEKALATEVAQGQVEGSSAMIVARYFLADQLLRHGAAERALDILSPSVSHAPNDWLTRLEEAHILHALNRKIEAKASATLAVEYAPTPEKAEQLRHNLESVFGESIT
jgi:tetratricopeptide (TPR) repeat protein